ncbi:MAG: hypothetical protein M5R41_18825 [Bacteroidia bacterium]|nr:hypothetical protein [Bacteroidia bacterium]
MPRYFTHFWSDELCGAHYREGLSGVPVEFTAGSGFLRKEVTTGDEIYLISVYDGQFLLLGKMTVGRVITSREEAILDLGPEIEDAREYVIAAEASSTPLQFTRQIAWETVGELRFIGLDGRTKPLKLADHEEADASALTGVRELTPASAALLDEALAEPFEDLPGNIGEMESEEIDDDDLKILEAGLPDAAKREELHAAAVRVAVKQFEASGWQVRVNDRPGPRVYDLHCSQDGHDLFLAVIGVEGSEMVFTFRELQYIAAEEESHYAICVVTKALSKRPELVTYTGDDLEDLFDARPLLWMFRPRKNGDFGQEDFD